MKTKCQIATQLAALKIEVQSLLPAGCSGYADWIREGVKPNNQNLQRIEQLIPGFLVKFVSITSTDGIFACWVKGSRLLDDGFIHEDMTLDCLDNFSRKVDAEEWGKSRAKQIESDSCFPSQIHVAVVGQNARWITNI